MPYKSSNLVKDLAKPQVDSSEPTNYNKAYKLSKVYWIEIITSKFLDFNHSKSKQKITTPI